MTANMVSDIAFQIFASVIAASRSGNTVACSRVPRPRHQMAQSSTDLLHAVSASLPDFPSLAPLFGRFD
jgi:hypothetical protein